MLLNILVGAQHAAPLRLCPHSSYGEDPMQTNRPITPQTQKSKLKTLHSSEAKGQNSTVSLRALARPISRRVGRHSTRYMEVFRLFRKYQLHHILLEFDPQSRSTDPASVAALERRAGNFAAALEELGPCFIKLGQLLSTRPDLLPPAYLQAMRRLQDRITPVPSAEVKQIIRRELGKPVEELF